jgi:hypothetical protein
MAHCATLQRLEHVCFKGISTPRTDSLTEYLCGANEDSDKIVRRRLAAAHAEIDQRILNLTVNHHPEASLYQSQNEYVVPPVEITATSPPGTDAELMTGPITQAAPGPRYMSLPLALLLEPIATFIGLAAPVFWIMK